MSRVLGIDFETTGLDFKKDRIVEVGYCIWDTSRKVPLRVGSDLLVDGGIRERLMDPDAANTVSEVSGLLLSDIEDFGVAPALSFMLVEALTISQKVEYVVAHNGTGFDKPFLVEEATKLDLKVPRILELPWIDTRLDLPFPKEPSSRRLVHLSAEHGFVNPFEHRALFDVLAMLKLMSKYDFQEVAAQALIPFVTVRAMVDYADRQLAKDARFSWEKLGDKTYNKCWVKQVRANKVEEFKQACKFPVVQLD